MNFWCAYYEVKISYSLYYVDNANLTEILGNGVLDMCGIRNRQFHYLSAVYSKNFQDEE